MVRRAHGGTRVALEFYSTHLFNGFNLPQGFENADSGWYYQFIL
jgi:hypothetical protein